MYTSELDNESHVHIVKEKSNIYLLKTKSNTKCVLW